MNTYIRGDGIHTCSECGIDINEKREGCTTCVVRSIENANMMVSFGDSEFCNRYRGTSGLLGRFVLFLDRLWSRLN